MKSVRPHHPLTGDGPHAIGFAVDGLAADHRGDGSILKAARDPFSTACSRDRDRATSADRVTLLVRSAT